VLAILDIIGHPGIANLALFLIALRVHNNGHRYNHNV
jgi:hypothetical protein